MTHPCEPWFSSLVFIEVIFQLPFFFLAVYALLNNGESKNNNNSLIRGDGVFRSLCMVYGSSTATTLVPIFASLLTDANTTLAEKGVLMGFYMPYFIFPVWLVLIAVCENNVFGSDKSNKKD